VFRRQPKTRQFRVVPGIHKEAVEGGVEGGVDGRKRAKDIDRKRALTKLAVAS